MKTAKKLKVVAIVLTILFALLFFSTSKEETIASGHNMTATTLSMTVGTKQSMTIPGISSGKAKWKSSNTKIATVSAKGVVSAKKVGSSTITGTYKGIKFTCKVTVKANEKNYNKILHDDSKVKVVLTSIAPTKIKLKVTNKTNKPIIATVGQDYVQLDKSTYYQYTDYNYSYEIIAPHNTKNTKNTEIEMYKKLSKSGYSKIDTKLECYNDSTYDTILDKRVSVKLK